LLPHRPGPAEVAIGLLWAWRGGGSAQAYLAGCLIEKSLSLDNVFVFAVIFPAFAIPARYQHRVLRYLQPGLAVILVGVAAKLLLADVYKFPAWASPAFIAVVEAVVAMLSIRDNRRATQQPAQGNQDRTEPAVTAAN
jgi:predicted tellurium resistance membrane protein TerC